MLTALINNQRVSPDPGIKGAVCECCNGSVIPACGDINIHHFRHEKGPDCDSWHEPMSKWHIDWQKQFNNDFTEVVVNNNGKKHRADVKNSKGTVVEFQNSPISVSMVKDRESFYGNMIWVFNADIFKSSIELSPFYCLKEDFIDVTCFQNPKQNINELKKDKQIVGFCWPYHRRKYILHCKKPVFVDLGVGILLWINFYYRDIDILPFRNNHIPRFIRSNGSIYIDKPNMIPQFYLDDEIISWGSFLLYKTNIEEQHLRRVMIETLTYHYVFYPAKIVSKKSFINHYNI